MTDPRGICVYVRVTEVSVVEQITAFKKKNIYTEVCDWRWGPRQRLVRLAFSELLRSSRAWDRRTSTRKYNCVVFKTLIGNRRSARDCVFGSQNKLLAITLSFQTHIWLSTSSETLRDAQRCSKGLSVAQRNSENQSRAQPNPAHLSPPQLISQNLSEPLKTSSVQLNSAQPSTAQHSSS